MANYCSCVLEISSYDVSIIDRINSIRTLGPPKNFLDKFKSLFKGKEEKLNIQLLQFLRPMPEYLFESLDDKSSDPEWRKWRVENWGCPHDAEIDDCIRVNPNVIKIYFHTQYSPPLPALEYFAKKEDVEYRILHCELGNGWLGIAGTSENKDYEYSLDKPPSEEGIPDELIKEFNLVAAYEEWKNSLFKNN